MKNGIVKFNEGYLIHFKKGHEWYPALILSTNIVY